MNVWVWKRRFSPRMFVVLAAASLAFLGNSFGEETKSASFSEKSSSFKNVKVEEFDHLRAVKNTITLDVRTPEEFGRGHVPGAVNVDWNAKDFAEKVAALDKNQTYLVHCAAGVRSAKACARMSKLNFTKLYNLEGGFKAWEQAGKPVEKTKLSEKQAQRTE